MKKLYFCGFPVLFPHGDCTFIMSQAIFINWYQYNDYCGSITPPEVWQDTRINPIGWGLSFDIYYSMDCYKSHRNIYFTISASTKKKFPSEVKRNEIKQNENKKMYRLTDILMSKTIQFSLLEFLIFHNPKSGDKVVRFISSFNTLWHVLLGVIAAEGKRSLHALNLLIRSESSYCSWIQLIFHILIYRRIERARSFSLYDNLIYFLYFICACYCLFTRSSSFMERKKSWLRFLFDFDLLLRAFKERTKIHGKRCGASDDSIKQFFERMNLFLTQLGNEFMEFLACSKNEIVFVS